jgi:NADH dehydrogenase
MQVAVFGAGYAGLTLARRLEKRLPDDVSLVVVDENGQHLLQHELHRVIRRPSVATELSIPLGDVLDRATIISERVASVDPDDGVARLTDWRVLEYDVGAVCLGAQADFHDLPGVEEHATPLKRLSHARDIRSDFLDVLDEGSGRIVVGGAGLSGVQVSGELAALATEEDAADDVEVVVLEQRSSVTPTFPTQFQEAVRTQLENRGIVVRTDTSVAAATAETITLGDGTNLSYDQFIWTGGIRGPNALDGERPTVNSTLTLANETFVLGDAARVVDADGEAVPASAQSAVKAGRVTADNVVRLVEHELADDADGFEPRLDRFRFDSPGWLVSIGDGAVAQVGPSVLTGSAASALKTSVGVGYRSSVGAHERAVDVVREKIRAGDD